MADVQVQDSHSSHCSWTRLLGALAADSERKRVELVSDLPHAAERGTSNAGYEGLFEGLFAAVNVSTVFSSHMMSTMTCCVLVQMQLLLSSCRGQLGAHVYQLTLAVVPLAVCFV
jgi:hypothetical protein